MDYKVVYSPSARIDLREIVEYISNDDIAAAKRIGLALIGATKNLSSFPRKGKIVPEFGIDSLREIQLAPYRIVYRVFDKPMIVEIVRVWHAARGRPEV
ncbi:type II toxin-antitoxin system RelE/ParE family toxin [Pelagicoccus mobilis]|uniref:Type II toxin-antitoxin system RelE/ParE family toxin n=1 Tax=Pelagicoccus mobilis TaxID=415221 RepID=A0A934VPI8_9BACT|nr:type II toxin-antitoxin system RelE/ParE family toxin [Pelagicoccus mobilis]MBK1875573.1 type II toxin-antitoxin system RelE/ParE family toxin [Pelagicoccus mobilis]